MMYLYETFRKEMKNYDQFYVVYFDVISFDDDRVYIDQ